LTFKTWFVIILNSQSKHLHHGLTKGNEVVRGREMKKTTLKDKREKRKTLRS